MAAVVVRPLFLACISQTRKPFGAIARAANSDIKTDVKDLCGPVGPGVIRFIDAAAKSSNL